MRKIETFILGLIFMGLIPAKSCGMERHWCEKLGNYTDAQTARLIMGNLAWFNEYYYQVKGSDFDMGVKDFVAARQANPQAPVSNLLRDYEVNKILGRLGLTPNPDQTTAGRYLFEKDRKDFTSDDIAATVYLQTNNGGQGHLSSPLPEPTLDQIDAIKQLIVLAIPQVTQDDLEATLHLQTNPDKIWDCAILSPTGEEIEAAKTLKSRAPTFTKDQLLQEWQRQVTERLSPRLQELAAESKRLSIRHYNQRHSHEKDLEAESLIQGTPEAMRENFMKVYNRFKEQALLTREDLLAGLAERRRIANRLFH